MSNKFLNFLSNDRQYQSLLKDINQKKQVKIFTPIFTGLSHLISNMAKDTNKNILYITNNPIDTIKNMIEQFMKIYATHYDIGSLPPLYNSPYTKIYPPLFKSKERISSYNILLNSDKKIIITNLISLLFPLPNKKTLKRYFLTLKRGQEIERDLIINTLKHFGYKEKDIVNFEGEMSIRGHIIDVFPINNNKPFRIDFEGDEIFSLKNFDVATQISNKKIDEITIFSINEFLLDSEKRELKPIIKEKWDKFHLKEKFKTLLSYWNDNLYYPKEELFGIIIRENGFLNYFKEYLIISDFHNSDEELSNIKEKWGKLYEETKDNEIAIDYDLFFDNGFLEIIKKPQILFTEFSSPETLYFNYKNIDKKNFVFEKYLKEHSENIHLIFTEDKNKKETLLKRTEERYLINIFLFPYAIEFGFNYKEQNIDFIPIGYILPEKIKKTDSEGKYKIFFSQFQDLKEGDIVVHTNYGIAEYRGIKKEKINGLYNDFILLEYAGGDKVYVSIDDFSLIYRYSGIEDYKPQLDKLGSKSWAKTKEKVKKGIFKIAEDLLKLYAKRKTYQGFSFVQNEELDDEFISLFEHNPTKDQTISWFEISEDMKDSKPMDRLLCGDVGFGKTEVAMRAAFRASYNNKQVAVLCPTTILANQHYRTFKKRFENYDVKIELLSRMVSPSKKKEIIKQTISGDINILIGTHSILSESIKFNDLGLLIIDEEQKFGVKHKDKILKLKEKIDVLTLTATPIPRTLNMAISGVKSLSIIETPPPGRMSIETYIEEINPEIIKEAIKTEIKRGGQTFIVYNNINKISGFKEYIQTFIPDAKIEFLHSKMNSRLIEKTMLKFINREFDVLISTTIIENGIDIPNVNTLIIIEAEHFGLSQLYQLRGRVGRGNRKAYAYFLINSHRLLTAKAKKRLKALKEFQDLGSGFRLAAMDLEIRGAGNLLGKEQHGHLKSVGFEYYLWLLNRAIKKLKGEKDDDFQPTINLPYYYSIPDNYIPQSSQRLNLYKRFASINDMKDLENLINEISDRFGTPPNEIYNLSFMIKIKLICKHLRIEKLSYNIRFEELVLKLSSLSPLSEDQKIKVIRKYKGDIKNNGLIEFNIKKSDLKTKLIELMESLSSYLSKNSK